MASSTPRPAGVDSHAFVGEAELSVKYRYGTLPRFEIELWVDLTAAQGSAGEIQVDVQADGFDVARGPTRWSKNVGEGAPESGSVVLRAGGGDTMSVTVVTTRADGSVELAKDTIRFVVDPAEDIVRECRPTDEACKK